MRSKTLFRWITAAATIVPLPSLAQQSSNGETGLVDEVVVTGSYIKRDKYDSPSPIESFSAEDIRVTGTPTLGEFVRDLTYTQNTDVVANVLSIQDGQQDSNSARFNLRGLGVDSTLTLFDGHRLIDTGNIGATVPDIATGRIEIVLDGGSAIYGTDAVAGVVNLIPLKHYDGVKFRTYYSSDEGGNLRQPKIELLLGKSFENGLNAVAAFDYSRKTPLLLTDRPQYLRSYDDDFTTTTPGTWRNLVGLPGTFLDPDCGTFNGNNTDDSKDGAFPSGYPGASTTGNRCIGEFGQFQDLSREAEDFNAYINLAYDLTDSIQLEFQTNLNVRESRLTGSPSVGDNTNNADLVVPLNHPANPFGQDVRPLAWSPFQQIGTLPSHLEDGNGLTPYHYETERYKIAAYYNLSASWEGETAFSFQRHIREVDDYQISFSRLQNALNGLGGPDCSAATGTPGAAPCEYFNPFGSADSRSPSYIAGVTDNSQALVDWLFIKDTYEDTREYLKYFQTHATGDLFDLPNGPVRAAVGFQIREDIERDIQSPLELARDDYNESDIVFNTNDKGEVRGIFVEVDIPLTQSLTMVVAARHEEFVDYDLRTTTPKISFHWEPIENLAFRASIGDSFVAPTASQLSLQSSTGCSPVSFGSDPFLPGAGFFALAGATGCSAGNPDLEPQTSVIKNFGVSWRNGANFQMDLDLQTIKYTDRIITFTRTDVLTEDLARAVAAVNNGTLHDTHSPDGSAVPDGFLGLEDWAESGMMNPLIVRDSTAGYVVSEITTYPQNVADQEVHVLDFKMRQGWDFNFGYVGVALNATGYKKHDYTGFDGVTLSAVGQRNADSNLAPPITRWKVNGSLNWTKENDSFGISFNYIDAVQFDGTFDTGVMDIGTGQPSTINPKSQTAPETIEDVTTVDLRYGHYFESAFKGSWDLSLGVRNVFDELPEPLPIFGGLETRLHTPFGRQYYIDITWEPSF